MDRKTIGKLLLLFATLSVLIACELPLLAPASSNPDSIPIETIIAGTAAAAQAQTAVMLPSPTQTVTLTSSPTSTPTDTPTSTPTFIFIIPTSTEKIETPIPNYNCQVVSQNPANNAKLVPGENFNAEWTVKNTGKETWNHTSVDFNYSSGTDMHNRDILDLPKSVSANGEVTLKAPMIAPENPGTYTSTWVIVRNKDILCELSITIIVE